MRNKRKKRHKINNWKRFLTSVFILIAIMALGIFLVCTFAFREPITFDKIEYESEKKIDFEAESALIEYMDLYYKSMQYLEVEDMTYLFEDPESDAALVNQTAIELLVESRQLKDVDLRIDTGRYDLTIENVEVNENEVKVHFTEDGYMNFDFMKDIESSIYDIENTITFVKVEDEYKIKEFDKVQSFFIMITEDYKGGGREELQKIKASHMKLIKANIATMEQYKIDYENEKGIKTIETTHSYDREKAVEYSSKWINTRNEEWAVFENNCQNHVSQSLHAGGIPFDYSGSNDSYLQWKYYDDAYDGRETAKGHVYTWSYVPFFQVYAKDNEGTGLVATVGENIYYAEKGDVIHVGTKDDESHAALVSDVYEKKGEVLDVLINSNSIDMQNYPLQAYSYPYITLIKVHGYN